MYKGYKEKAIILILKINKQMQIQIIIKLINKQGINNLS